MKKSIKPLLAVVLVAGSLGMMGQLSAMPYGDGSGDCMRGSQKMGPGGRHEGKGFNVDRMSRKLNLSDEQTAQVQNIVEESRQQFSDLRAKMQQNRENLRELVREIPFEKAKVRPFADAQGALKADMIVMRAQQRSEINAILTDEQREQMQNMRGKRR
jgi:Spy/CpxP family protein refolding chaperone